MQEYWAIASVCVCSSDKADHVLFTFSMSSFLSADNQQLLYDKIKKNKSKFFVTQIKTKKNAWLFFHPFETQVLRVWNVFLCASLSFSHVFFHSCAVCLRSFSWKANAAHFHSPAFNLVCLTAEKKLVSTHNCSKCLKTFRFTAKYAMENN